MPLDENVMRVGIPIQMGQHPAASLLPIPVCTLLYTHQLGFLHQMLLLPKIRYKASSEFLDH